MPTLAESIRVVTQSGSAADKSAAFGVVYGLASFSPDRESHACGSGHNAGELGLSHLRGHDHAGCEPSWCLRFDETAVDAQPAHRRAVSPGGFQRPCACGPLSAGKRRHFCHGVGVLFHGRRLEAGSWTLCRRNWVKISLDINSLCDILADVEEVRPDAPPSGSSSAPPLAQLPPRPPIDAVFTIPAQFLRYNPRT